MFINKEYNENETINITVIKHKESIFNVIIKKMNYEIKSSYKGYIENDKIQVIKG